MHYVAIFLFGNCDLNITHFHVFSHFFFPFNKGLERSAYQKRKTKEIELHAIQVSDYLKQSQEVKTFYLISILCKKHSRTQYFSNFLTVSGLLSCPLIGFYILHLNLYFEYLLSFFTLPTLFFSCFSLCNLSTQ